MEILAAILGLGIGGLVNHLADSLPRARRPERPHCLACSAPLTPVQWLATTALLARRFSCDYCGTRRLWRSLVVEAVSVFLSVWLLSRSTNVGVFFANLLITTIFLLIVIIDIEHRLILHIVSFPSAVIIGLLGILNPDRGITKTLLGGVTGLAIFFGLYLLGGVFAGFVARRRGQPLDEVAFGFGDVTLAGVIGLTVGFPGVLVALFLGILAAGFFSLGYIVFMLLRRRYTAFIPIPYGPFLVLGAMLVYFGGRTSLERLFGI